MTHSFKMIYFFSMIVKVILQLFEVILSCKHRSVTLSVNGMLCAIWHHFVQFSKHKKHPWKSVTFGKIAGLACNFTKSNSPPWVLLTSFLNCTTGTKLRNVVKIDFISYLSISFSTLHVTDFFYTP